MTDPNQPDVTAPSDEPEQDSPETAEQGESESESEEPEE